MNNKLEILSIKAKDGDILCIKPNSILSRLSWAWFFVTSIFKVLTGDAVLITSVNRKSINVGSLPEFEDEVKKHFK